jgi:phage-related minor tail protein
VLNEQVRSSQQSLGQLQEMANCACQATSQPSTESLGKSILKGAISGAISGLIGGIAGGGFGGGGEGSTPSLAGNPNYTNIGRRAPLYVKTRARGGRFSAFDAMVVGEEGPEIIIPERGGNMIPNPDVNREMDSGSNVTNIFNFTINSTDSTFSRKSQQQVTDAVARALERGRLRGR